MTRAALSLVALLLLTACSTVPSATAPIDASAGGCRKSSLRQFTGQAATQELAARMLKVSGATVIQWISPGTMVTMEFRADRLRVHLDAANRIERASCG